MDPITLAIGGACLVAGALGTIFLPKAYKAILIGYRGKSIHAIGPRGTGKTTILTYLATGMVINPNDHNSTNTPKNLGKAKRRLKHFDIEIYAQGLWDVSGGIEGNNKDNWKNAFNACNVTFYVTRADCLLDPDGSTDDPYKTAKRFETDFILLEDWAKSKVTAEKVKEGQKLKHCLFIIANVWNTSKHYADFKKNDATFREKLEQIKTIKTAIDKVPQLQCVRLVIGSLDTQEGIEAVLNTVAGELEANAK